MGWELIIDHDVRKQLKKFPKKDAERIVTAIKEFTTNPYTGDIDRMEGEKDAWRRRIGAYRIFYEINIFKRTIHVFEVKRRTSSTY